MQQLKDVIHLGLPDNFIFFENDGQMRAGLILGYKRISESYDPTSVEVAVDTEHVVVMKLAEIQNAYIMMPTELLEYMNKSAEMGAKALDTLNKIYGFLETLKAG